MGCQREKKHWCRPSEDQLKINSDGAYHSASGDAGCGFVIRDEARSPWLLDADPFMRKFFYLEHARELRVVVLIDRRIGPNYNAETTVWVSFLLQTCLKIDKQPQTKTLQHPNYGSSFPNAFAPASFHKHACSLISCSTGQASRWQP